MATITSKMILICLLLSLGKFTNSVKFGYVDVVDLIKFGHEVMTNVLESWELVNPRDPEFENSLPFIHRMERELKTHISRVSHKIDRFQEQMDVRLDTIVAKLLTEIPLQERLDQKLRMIDQSVGQINDLYNIFELYSMAPDKYAKFTLEDFARTCVSSRSGALPDLLKRIHRLFVPSPDEILSRSVIILLANQMAEASSQICNDNQSLQQLLYNLYTTITLTEIKGYSMIQFSYKLLRLYNPDANFTEEMNLVKQQYEKRTTETLRAVKTAMAFAPRQIWKCDARINKLDETYTTLTQLFQGYIVNEVDLNNEVSCKENCAYYEYSKVRGCYKNQYCSKQRKCNGRILNCEYVDSDMWVCPSSENSDRRYEYIEYENGQVFGQKGSCKNGKTKVDSWWRWLFWHCSYCFCYCDDNNINSDRYFSLRKVVSDVANNKVVTGVRFKKVNKVIHIQIQEGELMPRGNINRTSVQWKPIEAFNILDKNVTADVDYHTLYWEKRGIDLDDITLDKNYLLTGLKFRMVGTRLNLEVRMTSFNFTTGKLIKPLERSFWTSHDQTAREELALPRPDIPTRSPLLSLPDSVSEQYLNFAPSDRKSDAAQNTIPFIDIQPIEPNPPVPIAGAGVYHKGRTGSGGYVALRLITYDFSQHLQVDLSPTVETVIDDLTEIEIV
ncbi:chemokine-like protein orion isoform X1 [Xylocopa sonorina]|uniref:chemokine-like protein orion isoform X1 n=1 Tax=Xylocopa sonorina TaxID=1818115 RepID=UPI00403AA03D